MIITLQGDQDLCHSLIQHVMGETIDQMGEPQVQGKMAKALMMRGIMLQAG